MGEDKRKEEVLTSGKKNTSKSLDTSNFSKTSDLNNTKENRMQTQN